jgi:hypothetical protein
MYVSTHSTGTSYLLLLHTHTPYKPVWLTWLLEHCLMQWCTPQLRLL